MRTYKSPKKTKQSSLFFSMTFEFLEEYMPKQIGRSKHTIESYRDSLTLFRQYVTELREVSIAKFAFADCTKDLLFDFRKHLEQNGSQPSTINVRMTAIRAYLNFAADKDVALQSVALAAATIPPRKKVQKEKETLSEEALAAILAAPPMTKTGMRDRAIIITLYDSALRLEELLSVRLCDISLHNNHPSILIEGKGKKERRISLTEKTVGHLKQFMQVFHSSSVPNDDLFSTTNKGVTKAMSPGNVQRILKKYAEGVQKGVITVDADTILSAVKTLECLTSEIKDSL